MHPSVDRDLVTAGVEEFRKNQCEGLYQTLAAVDTGKAIDKSEIKTDSSNNILIGDRIRDVRKAVEALGAGSAAQYVTAALDRQADSWTWLCKGRSGSHPDAFEMLNDAKNILAEFDGSILNQDVVTVADLQCSVDETAQRTQEALRKHRHHAVTSQSEKTLAAPSLSPVMPGRDGSARKSGVAI